MNADDPRAPGPTTSDRARIGLPDFLQGLLPPLLLVLLTIAAHAWTLALGLALDDFDFLADTHRGFRADAYLFGGLQPGRNPADDLVFAYVLRPTLFLSLWCDQRLFGTDVPLLHASSVAHHVVAVLLLYALVRRLMPAERGRRVAFLGALALALHPAKQEAVGWVGTRGDLLVGLLALVAAHALLSFRRGGSALYLAAAALAALAATGAKESGAIAPLLVVGADIFFLRRAGSRRSLKIDALTVFSVGGATILYAAVRFLRFGDKALVYGGEARRMTEAIAWRMLRNAWPTAERLFAGSFLPEARQSVAFTVALSTFLGVLGLGTLVLGRRRALAVVGLLGLAAAAFAPGLRFLEESSAVDLSRLFYLTAIPLMTAWGLALAALLERAGLLRWVAVLAAVVFALAAGRLAVDAARLHLDAADEGRRVIAEIERSAATAPPGTVLVIENAPPGKGVAPGVGGFLRQALSPPFREPPLPVVESVAAADFVETIAHLEFKQPMRFLRWDVGEKALVAVTDVLDAPGIAPPALEIGAHAAVRTVAFSPRSAPTLTVVTDQPGVGLPIFVRLGFASGKTLEIGLEARPEFAPTVERMVVLFDKPGFVLEKSVTSLEVHGVPGGPRIERILFDRPPGVLAWSDEDLRLRASLTGPEPEYAFSTTTDYPLYRFEIATGEIRVAWHVRSDQVRRDARDPERRTWRLSDGGEPLGGASLPKWPDVAAALRRLLDEKGLDSKDVFVRVSGFRGDPVHAIAFSSVLRLTLYR